MILYLIAIAASLFLALLFAGYYVWNMFFTAPYVPSFGRPRKDLLDFAREYYPRLASHRSAELGAGDANISFALTAMGYQADAIELNSFLTLFARLRKFLSHNRRINILNKDMFKCDYSQYDLAVIYLYPALMARLEPILFAQMPKGSVIISNTFSFKNHQPKEKRGKVLVYEVA